MKRIVKQQFWGMLLFALVAWHPIPLNSQTYVQFGRNKHVFDGILNDYRVNFRGNIKVADNDRDIVSISEDGYLEIEKKTFGNNRKLKIYPVSDGKLVYEYFEGLKKINFEPVGRKWMEEILPDIVRSTGIDIEGRVARIYKKGGINAILTEIGSIKSDFIAAKYFRVLIKQEKLTEKDNMQAIMAVPVLVNSDFERAGILIETGKYYIGGNALSEAFFISCAKISSDFEKGRVLKSLNISGFNENQQAAYIKAGSYINSDFEKANVFRFLFSKTEVSPKAFVYAAEVVSGMNSDFEKGNVFKVMLTKTTGDNELIAVFKAVSGMSSDFEKGNVLKIGSKKINPASRALEAYFDAINTMNSDFEQANVLKSIINQNNGDDALFIRIFVSAAGLNSDFEKSNVLLSAAGKMPKTEKVKEEYIKTAKTISSSYEFGRVMKAVF